MRCGPLSSLLLPLAGARREDSRPFMVDAELKRFRKKVDAWARMQEARGARQRLSAAVTTRARGTDLFKKGDIEAALNEYQRAVDLMTLGPRVLAFAMGTHDRLGAASGAHCHCLAGKEGLVVLIARLTVDVVDVERQIEAVQTDVLLPCLSNLAMCCVKMGLYRQAAQHSEWALHCRLACRRAPTIAAKAALRALQAHRALGDTLRARRWLCTARYWASLSDGDVPDAVEEEARALAIRGNRRKAVKALEALVAALQGGEASTREYLEKAPSLWGAQCDPDCADEHGMTPLLLAVQIPPEERLQTAVAQVVEGLLSHRASPDCREYAAGRTALMFACNHGNTVVARMLLAAGADANVADSQGFSALHCTCVDYKAAKHSELLPLLLAHGANVNASTIEGFTPLAYLAQQSHESRRGGARVADMRVLIAAGADPCGPSYDTTLGYNAYCFAHQNHGGRDSAPARLLWEAAEAMEAAGAGAEGEWVNTCEEDARCLEYISFYNDEAVTAFNSIHSEIDMSRALAGLMRGSTIEDEHGKYRQEVRTVERIMEFFQRSSAMLPGLTVSSANGNPLLALYRAIIPRLPRVMFKLFPDNEPHAADVQDGSDSPRLPRPPETENIEPGCEHAASIGMQGILAMAKSPTMHGRTVAEEEYRWWGGGLKGVEEQYPLTRFKLPSRHDLHWLQLLALNPISKPEPPLTLVSGSARGASQHQAFWVPTHYSQLHLTLLEPIFHTFAFSVPSDDALALVARLASGSVLVELGAGTGYWAALLRQRGVQVRAYDIEPPDTRCRNMFFCHTFTEVLAGGCEVLDGDGAGNAGMILLLVWPFNEAEHRKRTSKSEGQDVVPWDAKAVLKFLTGGGNVVVHVGELPNHQDSVNYGTNTSVQCQNTLEEHFTCEQRMILPSWPPAPGADVLSVWRRKED